MKPSDLVQQHRIRMIDVLGQHRVENPRVFGSVAKGTDTEASDLDLLVEPTPSTTLLDLGDLQEQLETLLGIPVHVVTPKELHPRFRDKVIAEAIAL